LIVTKSKDKEYLKKVYIPTWIINNRDVKMNEDVINNEEQELGFKLGSIILKEKADIKKVLDEYEEAHGELPFSFDEFGKICYPFVEEF